MPFVYGEGGGRGALNGIAIINATFQKTLLPTQDGVSSVGSIGDGPALFFPPGTSQSKQGLFVKNRELSVR